MSNWRYQQNDSIGDEITIKGTHASGNWSLNFHVDAYHTALFHLIDNKNGNYAIEVEADQVWHHTAYPQLACFADWLVANFDYHTNIDDLMAHLDRCI